MANGNGSSGKKLILHQGDRSKKQLEEFIFEALNDVERGPVTQVACMHMVAGGQLSEVYVLNVVPQQHDAAAIAKVIRGRAEAYAGGLSNQQTFVVLVFHNNSDEADSRMSFSLTGRSEFDGATEAPDERGQRAQNMRHHENLIGQTYRMQESLNRHSLELLAAERARVAAVQSENDRLMGFMKQVMADKIMAENNREMERLKYERDTKEREKLMSFAPMLVNSLTGKEVFPVAHTDSLIVDQIVRVIRKNPEVIQGLAGADLAPEAMAMLMQRFTQVAEKQDAEEKAVRAIHPEVADPEAEAAGELQPDPRDVKEGEG